MGETATEVIKELKEKNNQLEEMLAEQYPDLKQSLNWANEREKELQEEIKALKKTNNELQAQIEKMKCCEEEELSAMEEAEQFLEEKNKVCPKN